MAVPKKKKSAAKSKQHRAHNALKAEASVKCPKCGEKKRPHHICSACGAYGDKQVIAN
jgi:large subunit ribosomal protein L32